MSYHVVLKGRRGDAPGDLDSLAQAISKRYGVPAAAIVQRLRAGAFRVKSNVDLETARRYAGDLAALGGDCVVLDVASGAEVELSRSSDPEPVGLAAAGGSFAASLGALEEGQLALATLDEAASPTRSGRRAPAPADDEALLQLDDGPYVPPGEPAGDRFAPPPSDVADDALLVLEDDPIVEARRRAAAPPPEPAAAPPAEPVAALEAAAAIEPAAEEAAPGPSVAQRASSLLDAARASLAGRGRAHFLSGVLVAVLLGFPVAHLVASVQEASAYSQVRSDLRKAYAEATDPETYAGLSEIRAGARDLMDARQHRIAVTGALVWLAVAAAVAYAWFRLVPWQRLASRTG